MSGRMNVNLERMTDYSSIMNRGNMDFADDSSVQNYEKDPTCATGSPIVYVWALF